MELGSQIRYIATSMFTTAASAVHMHNIQAGLASCVLYYVYMQVAASCCRRRSRYYEKDLRMCSLDQDIFFVVLLNFVDATFMQPMLAIYVN